VPAPAIEDERVTGIEPASPAWKAGALPLSYTRVCCNIVPDLSSSCLLDWQWRDPLEGSAPSLPDVPLETPSGYLGDQQVPQFPGNGRFYKLWTGLSTLSKHEGHAAAETS
jgi:hypothetical protein